MFLNFRSGKPNQKIHFAALQIKSQTYCNDIYERRISESDLFTSNNIICAESIVSYKLVNGIDYQVIGDDLGSRYRLMRWWFWWPSYGKNGERLFWTSCHYQRWWWSNRMWKLRWNVHQIRWSRSFWVDKIRDLWYNSRTSNTDAIFAAPAAQNHLPTDRRRSMWS